MATSVVPALFHARLLKDIAEIREEPYPNVAVHVEDSNLSRVCLVLTPEGEAPLHLTVDFSEEYPIRAPEVTMDSAVVHPNVFGNYICASMLDTDEGWTAAYTLKAIAIQLLSFFTSDRIEQDHAGQGAIDIAKYREDVKEGRQSGNDMWMLRGGFCCNACGFGKETAATVEKGEKVEQGDSMFGNGGGDVVMGGSEENAPAQTGVAAQATNPNSDSRPILTLANELVLLVLGELSTEDIVNFCTAIPAIKQIIYSADFIRLRELQCFCLKKSLMDSELGIGVSVIAGTRPQFRSEFELLSDEAFHKVGVRKSIQGVGFDHWVALPLSRRHWNNAKQCVIEDLERMARTARLPFGRQPAASVLFHFMNQVVVDFSNDTKEVVVTYDNFGRPRPTGPDERSTLTHASEKAVESYFALYHLLLCVAIDNPRIIRIANEMISRFLAGRRNKNDCPDLGHLLVAALISDAGLTKELVNAIIREAVTRNVVWMLNDPKDPRKGMKELAYLEPSGASDYRLENTFRASPTSYRLLMFIKLFSTTARTPGKTLVQLRDQLFDETHGAPPPGKAAVMARQIKNIRSISNFEGFLTAMGLPEMVAKPDFKADFSAFLRNRVRDSINAGYSVMPLTQSQLFILRRMRDPAVPMSEDVDVGDVDHYSTMGRWESFCDASFFPNRGGNRRGGRGGGGRGWQGRGRGSYRTGPY